MWLGGNKDAWFIFHRLLMVLTWCLTIAAFFLIFAHLDFTWTEIPFDENPHALLGCITTGLCFIQPFMAMLRPHPGDTMRPLFNWAHWFVGNSALGVGLAAIFLAVDLDKAELPAETVYLLVSYVIFYAIIHISLTLVNCITQRKNRSDGSDINLNRYLQKKDCI